MSTVSYMFLNDSLVFCLFEGCTVLLEGLLYQSCY